MEIGDDVHYVRPPTVREAISILAAVDEAESQEDADYIERAFLEPWLPRPVLNWYSAARPARKAEILNHLLLAGAKLPKPAREQEGDLQVESDWTDALARYIFVYGGNAWDVYDSVPFPFFCLMLSRADREIARRSLTQVEVAVLPHVGEESGRMIDSMQRRAGYVKGAETVELDADFYAQAKAYRAQYEEAKRKREAENEA